MDPPRQVCEVSLSSKFSLGPRDFRQSLKKIEEPPEVNYSSLWPSLKSFDFFARSRHFRSGALSVPARRNEQAQAVSLHLTLWCPDFPRGTRPIRAVSLRWDLAHFVNVHLSTPPHSLVPALSYSRLDLALHNLPRFSDEGSSKSL